MKRLIFYLGFMASMVASVCSASADEIRLGTIVLTENQKERLHELQVGSPIINHFVMREDQYVVFTKRPITTSEKNTIIADMKALSDDPPKRKQNEIDFQGNVFNGMTADEASAHIDANVVSIVDARDLLRETVKYLIYVSNHVNFDQ